MVLLGMAGFAAEEKSEHKAGDIMSVDIGGGVKMDFVWCPPGQFMMGRPDSENERVKNESPQHKVTFAKGFWIGKHEVTQAQWKSNMKDCRPSTKGDDLPMDMLVWEDCQAFLCELHAKTGGNFRLPTEAEWEYAWHDVEYIHPRDAKYVYPYTPEYNFQPSAWGLCKIQCGRAVTEWCQDWFHEGYNGAPADGSAGESPPGKYHVLRGALWGNPGDGRQTKTRRWYGNSIHTIGEGFRIVCVSSPR
jgi:formylglycine-generating enzyme required for sulfatase activity